MAIDPSSNSGETAAPVEEKAEVKPAPKIETAKAKEKKEKAKESELKYAPKYGTVGKVTITRGWNLADGNYNVQVEYYTNIDDDCDVILARVQPLIDGLAPKVQTRAPEPQPQLQPQPEPQKVTDDLERYPMGQPEPATSQQYRAMYAIWHRLGKPEDRKPRSGMTKAEASEYISKYGGGPKVTPASELPKGVRRQYF